MKRREFITLHVECLGGLLVYTLAGVPIRLNSQEGTVRLPLKFFTANEARVIAAAQAETLAAGRPIFKVDPYWPKMEGNWMFGSIGGVVVDPTNDHVWVLQRPRTLDYNENYAAQKPPVGDCCVPAPPVMEFDAAGNFIQGWGGPGPGYDWPDREHGISIDYRGNVWIGAGGKNDGQVLKFTKTGKFLLQIGHPGKNAGSTDIENLNLPTKAVVYPNTNEVFISDGYVNRRVIVFDADTGAFKRMWGAYGNKPDDTVAPRILISDWDQQMMEQRVRPLEGPPAQQFNMVHGIAVSNDGLVYVSDMLNRRIQVFKLDGTFVKEVFVSKQTHNLMTDPVDLAFSPDSRQQFLYHTSQDQHIWILNRETLQVVGSVGRLGRYPGQFWGVDQVATDSKGNLYTGENRGKRVQKFLFEGFSSTRSSQ